MPLDFTHAHAPPTLGKRRTKEEIKRALQKKYDVKAGLREQGGFTNIHSTFTSYDDKRREEYASIIARQEEQATAQFGEIPDDWTYFSRGESEDLVAMMQRGFYDRNLTLLPRVTCSKDSRSLSRTITVTHHFSVVRANVSDEELDVDLAATDPVDMIQYVTNHLIRQLAQKFKFREGSVGLDG